MKASDIGLIPDRDLDLGSFFFRMFGELQLDGLVLMVNLARRLALYAWHRT